MDNEGLLEMVGILRYRVDAWHMSYLGLKIGGRVKGTEAWKRAAERIIGRLKRWDSKTLSMGGRVTIMKSILTSIPLYTLSYLRLAKTIESKMRSMMCQFLWGGEENEGDKKVTWVGWKQIKILKMGGCG